MGEIRWSGVLQNATRNRYPRRVAFWRTPLRNGNPSSAGSARNTKVAAISGRRYKPTFPAPGFPPNLQSSIPWPASTAAQFAEIRKLLPDTGPDANTLAACFGKKTKARIHQIEEILETLRPLGKLE